MALDHLRTDALPAQELLLGEEEVRVTMIEPPDPVEQCELAWGVKAQVADELSDVGPVLLLDVGPVVLVARPGAGEGDLVIW